MNLHIIDDDNNNELAKIYIDCDKLNRGYITFIDDISRDYAIHKILIHHNKIEIFVSKMKANND